MRSLVVLAFVVFAAGGCLSADAPDGALKCSDVPKRACPEGYYCLAGDNTCWHDGHYPDFGVVEPPQIGPPEPDFSVALGDDMSVVDGGGEDAAPPADLSQSD